MATTLRSLPSGEIAGILPGGGEVLIGSGGLEVRSGALRHPVRDPRETPSSQNRIWKISASSGPQVPGAYSRQEIAAISPSGAYVVTVAETDERIEPSYSLPPELSVYPRHVARPAGGIESATGWLRLWEAATGSPVSSWLWHESPVVGASFTSDGQWLVTITRDACIRRWPVLELPSPDDQQWLAKLGNLVSGMQLSGIADTRPMSNEALQQLRIECTHLLIDRAASHSATANWVLKQRLSLPSEETAKTSNNKRAVQQ